MILAYWIRDLSYCPRKREATRQRQCFKSCFDDTDCRSRYRSCVCDYDCGMSCVKRGMSLVSSRVVLFALQLPGISCPFLTAPEHGHITYSQGNKFGSRATYECDAGYLLEGAKYRHCQGDMWWGPSDTIPYCAKEGKTMSSENGCDQTRQSKFIRSQDDRGDLLILHVLSRWFGSIRFLSWYIHIH